MPLKLHDTLTRTKQEFKPLRDDRVTMYVCGPTVYNHAHIGNARPAVVFDVLFRLLQRLYPDRTVTYARNITDVDDKINQKAADEAAAAGLNANSREVAERFRAEVSRRYTDIYHRDLDGLNCLRPSVEPRATAHMGEMVALIEQLLDLGMAYVSSGEVLFDVAKFDAGSGRYGALSNRSLDDMIAGARVEVAGNKENAADFVLWKPSRENEPVWDGPRDPATGEVMAGRPGWHIECSAMAEKVLGLPFDIHGGGLDLIFPHHTNEIAQSCAAHGLQANTDYARFWMHNGFLTMDAEKMSKSLGNVSLISELLERQPGEVLRWALLSAHYRGPLDWTDQLVDQARANLDRLYQVLRDAMHILARRPAEPSRFYSDSAATDLRPLMDSMVQGRFDKVITALENDLNTPAALAGLFEIAEHLRLAVTAEASEAVASELEALRRAAGLLGVLQQDPDAWFEGGADEAFKARVEALLSERMAARAAKDWAAADRIRDELTALNVVVMDGPNGATWRKG